MTLYLNFRSRTIAGSVVDARVMDGDGTAMPPALRLIPEVEVPGRFAGRSILFAVHGFNVPQQPGACALGNLEAYLTQSGVLRPSNLFVGVLWPGDYWIPAINYPFEGNDAIACGQRLAAFCNRWLDAAPAISFISHSLGARLVLEAVANMRQRAHLVCLAAAAINRDCLGAQYAVAAENADSIAVLASRQDLVLRLAYPVGDMISDILNPDHAMFRGALGRNGPALPAPPHARLPWQIPDQDSPAHRGNFGHGDYLPPGSQALPNGGGAVGKWTASANFMGRAYRGQLHDWP